MSERRVAIQFINVLPYMLEDYIIQDENWQPIVLLPARAANMDTPNWLMRFPQAAVQIMQGKTGCRPRTARYTGATADGFFGVNTGDQR